MLDSVVLPEGPDVFDRSTLSRVGPGAAPALRRDALPRDHAATRAATSPPSCAASSAARCAARSSRRRAARRAARWAPSTCSTSCSRATSTRRCAPTSPPRCAARCTATCAPILRLQERADTSTTPTRTTTSPAALFATTTCEEGSFPWERSAAPRTRADAGDPRGARDPARPARAVRRAHRAARRRHPAVRRRGRTRRPRRRPPGRCRRCRRSSSTATPTCARRSPTPARSRRRSPAPRSSRSRSSGTPSSAPTRPGARKRRSRRVLRRPSRSSRAPRRRRSSRRRRIAPTRLSRVPGAGRARKTANAAAETLQDVAAGLPRDRRRPPQGRRASARGSAACAAARRAGRRPGSACAASSTCRACASAASRRGRQTATTTVTVSGDGAPSAAPSASLPGGQHHRPLRRAHRSRPACPARPPRARAAASCRVAPSSGATGYVARGQRPRGCADGQRPRARDLPLPPPAPRQPGRLAPLGRGGPAPRARARPAAARLDRLLGLPLVPRHGARVVRGPADRGADERALRLREGRPRGAPGRRRALHGGRAGDDRPRRLAAQRVRHARAGPVLRRHVLPARAAPGHAELAPGARRGGRGVADAQRRDPRPGRADGAAPAGRRAARALGRADSTRPRWTTRSAMLRRRLRQPQRRLGRRAEVPGGVGDRVPPAPRRAAR